MLLRVFSGFLLIFNLFSQPDTLSEFHSVNASVRQKYSLTSDPYGNALVLWQTRKENAKFTEIYCHYILREGNYPFGKNGLKISFLNKNLFKARFVARKENSFVVSFIAQDKDSSYIYLQEISLYGNLLYGHKGKKIFQTHEKIHNYKILTVSDKYLYLAVNYDKKLIIQKQFLYGTNNVKKILFEKDKNIRKFFLLPAAAYGCILVWEVFNGKWEVKAQKILANGRLAWNDGKAVTISNEKYAMENPVIVHDGLGGLMCAYEKASVKSRKIHLLRINSSGKKIYHLPISVRNARHPKILKYNASVFIIWKENETDLLIQKIHIPTGKKQLNPEGYYLLFGEEKIVEYNLAFNILYNYFLLTWKNNSKVIYGKFIGMEENIQELSEKFVVHSEYKNNIEEFATQADNLGNVWFLYKTAKKAKLQNIDPHAFYLFPKDLPLHKNVPKKYIRPFKNLTTSELSEGKIVLAWEDVRNGDKDIYIQILDSSGKELLTKHGLPAVTDTADQILPQIQPVKQGFFLLWTTKISETENILLTMFFNLQGEKQWEKPLILAKGKGARIAPKTLNMQENLLTAWIDTRNLKETGFDIYMQLIGQDRSIRWDIYGKPLTKNNGYQTEPRLLKLSDNHFLLAWMDDKTGTYQIYYQYYDLNLLPLMLPWEGKILYKTGRNQRNLALTKINGNIAWAWSDAFLGENSTRIKILLTNPVNGKNIFPKPIECAKVPSKQIVPRLLALDEHKLAVFWEDSRNQKLTDFNLYAQLIDIKSQTLLWNLSGVRIGEYLLPFAEYNVLKIRDTLTVTWQRVVDNKRKMYVFTRLVLPVFNFQPAQAVSFTTENQTEGSLVRTGKNKALFLWIQEDKILYKKL